MKKLINTVALILGVGLASLTTTVQAQAITETPNYTLKTYIQDDLSRVWVYVHKNDVSKVSLRLKDEKERILYIEEVSRKKTEHAFKIDMSGLSNGTYFLEITDGKTPIMKTFRKEYMNIEKPVVSQRLVALN